MAEVGSEVVTEVGAEVDFRGPRAVALALHSREGGIERDGAGGGQFGAASPEQLLSNTDQNGAAH